MYLKQRHRRPLDFISLSRARARRHATRARMNTIVAIDGQLLCVQRGPTGGWCVHCYRVDEASRHFVLRSSVDVRGALGGEASDVDLSTAELVAADAVTDTAASLQTVALAFRRRRGATHDYWLGTVRLEPPASVSAGGWHAFELAEVEAQALTDGPALVMVHAIVGGGHALSVASLASAGGVRLRTVPLPGRASLLGATSWSGAAATVDKSRSSRSCCGHSPALSQWTQPEAPRLLQPRRGR